MTRRPRSVALRALRQGNLLRDLDPQQQLFLAVLLELGGGPQHGAEAALAAGYAETYEQAERCARILLKSPKIIDALKDGVLRRFDAAAAAAFNTLLEICTSKTAPASARVSAAQEILNRSKIGPVPSRSMSIVANTGIEDLIERIDADDRATVIDGEAAEIIHVQPNGAPE